MGLLSARRFWGSVAGLLLVVAAISFILWLVRPRWDETVIRQSVITTIQSEAPSSFYVTGTLEVAATSEVEDTRVLFPNLLPLNLGTTRATVRLPGTVAYGFDVSELESRHVAIRPDGVVEVTLPELRVFSVEPNLAEMEIRTDVGWARTHARSGQSATQEAIRLAQDILRRQAEAHLQSSAQPRINSAAALQTLLTPVLESAGLTDPVFTFKIGPHLVVQPQG